MKTLYELCLQEVDNININVTKILKFKKKWEVKNWLDSFERGCKKGKTEIGEYGLRKVEYRAEKMMIVHPKAMLFVVQLIQYFYLYFMNPVIWKENMEV